MTIQCFKIQRRGCIGDAYGVVGTRDRHIAAIHDTTNDNELPGGGIVGIHPIGYILSLRIGHASPRWDNLSLICFDDGKWLRIRGLVAQDRHFVSDVDRCFTQHVGVVNVLFIWDDKSGWGDSHHHYITDRDNRLIF